VELAPRPPEERKQESRSLKSSINERDRLLACSKEAISLILKTFHIIGGADESNWQIPTKEKFLLVFVKAS
jgi:hypothetical protein